MMIIIASTGAKSFFELISLLLVFIFVLVGAFYSTKLVSKIQIQQGKNKNLAVIETLKVSTNKFIQVIKAGDKYLVIAISKDKIELLTELDSNKIIINQSEEKNNFKDIINKIQNKSKKD